MISLYFSLLFIIPFLHFAFFLLCSLHFRFVGNLKAFIFPQHHIALSWIMFIVVIFFANIHHFLHIANFATFMQFLQSIAFDASKQCSVFCWRVFISSCRFAFFCTNSCSFYTHLQSCRWEYSLGRLARYVLFITQSIRSIDHTHSKQTKNLSNEQIMSLMFVRLIGCSIPSQTSFLIPPVVEQNLQVNFSTFLKKHSANVIEDIRLRRNCGSATIIHSQIFP